MAVAVAEPPTDLVAAAQGTLHTPVVVVGVVVVVAAAPERRDRLAEFLVAPLHSGSPVLVPQESAVVAALVGTAEGAVGIEVAGIAEGIRTEKTVPGERHTGQEVGPVPRQPDHDHIEV